MNSNAANALLKTLEEPPERGVLFLVSHAPGGLLPTIRSRCRRLVFRPWEAEAVADFVRARTDLSQEAAVRLARMAKGSPGRALALVARQAVALDDAAHELLVKLPEVDYGAMQALTDSFRGPEGFSRFELLFERLADQVHSMEVAAAMVGPVGSDRWGVAWDVLCTLPRQVEGLNLDRADALWTAMDALRAAARA